MNSRIVALVAHRDGCAILQTGQENGGIKKSRGDRGRDSACQPAARRRACGLDARIKSAHDDVVARAKRLMVAEALAGEATAVWFCTCNV
jgi:hypothetical protein